MDITRESLFFAFSLTLLAGLSTGIGSILAFYTKQTNKKFLSAALGFPDPALMRMGLFSALAVALHNIPEGIAVAVPIYFATGNRRKAFFYSLLSGLSEPLGAVIGYFLLMQFIGPTMFGLVLFA